MPALLFLFCMPALGITLGDYKEKVNAARSLVSEAETELNDGVGDQSRLRALVRYIREKFPASEQVEWDGGTVETSNAWLLEKNTALENDSLSKTRRSVLVEMREYLSAISFKLHELEQAAAPARTKDEDKQKLAEILRREEYQKPQPQGESAVQRWVRKFIEWLESIFPRSAGSQDFSGIGVLAYVLQVALVIALLALLGFLAYKIVPLIFPHMRRVRAPKKRDRVILGEQIAEHETARDLFGEAERLAREGNLRGAIRKGYIALLCDLSDRKVIGLARNKTNRDYLRDVRSRRDLHPRMKTVTDTFERHWYGFQRSDEQDWVRFREEYDRAIHSV